MVLKVSQITGEGQRGVYPRALHSLRGLECEHASYFRCLTTVLSGIETQRLRLLHPCSGTPKQFIFIRKVALSNASVGQLPPLCSRILQCSWFGLYRPRPIDWSLWGANGQWAVSGRRTPLHGRQNIICCWMSYLATTHPSRNITSSGNATYSVTLHHLVT